MGESPCEGQGSPRDPSTTRGTPRTARVPRAHGGCGAGSPRRPRTHQSPGLQGQGRVHCGLSPSVRAPWKPREADTAPAVQGLLPVGPRRTAVHCGPHTTGNSDWRRRPPSRAACPLRRSCVPSIICPGSQCSRWWRGPQWGLEKAESCGQGLLGGLP